MKIIQTIRTDATPMVELMRSSSTKFTLTNKANDPLSLKPVHLFGHQTILTTESFTQHLLKVLEQK